MNRRGSTGAMPERIPDIPYEGHPIYVDAPHAIRLRDRLLAMLRVGTMAAYVVGVRIRQSLRRVGWTAVDSGPCLENLNRDGVSVHRLSPSARQDLIDATASHFDRLKISRSLIAHGDRGYCDNQLDTSRDDAPELFDAVERVLAQAGVLSAVRAYLGCRAKPRRVTMQINDEWDRFWRAHFEDRGLEIPATAFFHVDNTYGVVKAIFYLSEVAENNGPFSYVPQTHRIRVGILEALLLRATDIWLDVYPQERYLFLALPRFLRKKAKFGDDLRAGDDWGQWLVDHERAMTSRDGDLFVFDVKGVHRGGMVERGERRVLQIMMS